MSSQPTGVENVLEQICQENLEVYRASQARLQEDVSQEAEVAHDYRGRLVYEILQNADDSLIGEDTGDDQALFRLTDSELWVANTGRPFSADDVRGLCGLGASSKTQAGGPRRASIGHKGLGFKSVLEITEAPEAYSETVCFTLGRDSAMDRVTALWETCGRGKVRGVPAMRFPSAITNSHPVWHHLRKDGYRSAFRFPSHSKVTSEQRAALARQLVTLPITSVLFLKHLEDVVFEVATTAERGERRWLLERSRVTPAGLERCGSLSETGLYRVDLVGEDGEADRYWVAHDADVRIGDHRAGLTGPAWDGVEISEVSVAVRDAEDPRIEPSARRFHVFLPAKEPSGCSVLVNGAFSTDLSRQHVQVTDSVSSYNAYLIRRAAGAFAETLVPHLLSEHDAGYVLRVLEQGDSGGGDAAALMRIRLTAVLADTPLLPSGEATLTLAEAVLPSPILGTQGSDFARLLTAGSVVDTRRFPDPPYCAGDLAAVAASYGAVALSPAGTMRALATRVDHAIAVLRPEPAGRFSIDPVLELCAALWEKADAADRQELQKIARQESVFPVGVNDDGTVNRIILGGESAFYPPRSSAEDLPLRRLRFLAHAVCWGSLGRTEQRSVLEHQMRAWDALFEIKEFRFEEVMRAAVLPGLARAGTADTELREANRSLGVLAAICRLAGKTTKPDQPLPMARLGSDRAFFNLSRLEVPCRSQHAGGLTWVPAYRVYFGRDWVAQDSVEEIAEAMDAAGKPMAIHFLAPPKTFDAYASTIGVQADSDGGRPLAAPGPDDGEVGIDDDTDEVLETTAIDRWRNFFSWLGVNRGLRLVHFHDVDSGTGWTTTKELARPGGSAFTGLDKIWKEFRAEIELGMSADPRWDSTDHYLYQVHNLDRLDEIAAVAKTAGNDVADRLLAHLVRNWPTYGRHTRAVLALVTVGKWPGSRKPPQQAYTEELATAGPDFWLFRLRRHAICSTSHGPRRPDQTWRRSDELLRRFGRGGRDADDYLPVLRRPINVSASSLRACLDELRVRDELTPAVFTLTDADELCRRISKLYQVGVTEQILRTQLRPIYRQLFELLVGNTGGGNGQLSGSPLAARMADGVTFLPARNVVYASVPGSRERSGVQGKVPLFVLEAEPGALAPLRNLFGTPLLEHALEWSVQPSETPFEAQALESFRRGLRELIPPLLARLSADRAENAAADRRAMLQFVQAVEPVEALTLSCSFRGEDLGQIPQRTYHVRRTEATGLQAFVVWTGPPWPPAPEDAQTLAMALAEALDVNMIETFLSFINASTTQRKQLLDLAGAAERLDEVEHELASAEEVANTTGEVLQGPEPVPSDGDSVEPEASEPHPAAEEARSPAGAPVPLYKFEDLLIDGQVLRVEGAPPGTGAGKPKGNEPEGAGPAGKAGASALAPRVAAATDHSELDRLGMRITIAFERRRVGGSTVVVLPGDQSPAAADALIVDVSSPMKVEAAIKQSSVVAEVFNRLATEGISRQYPGFDVLTIKDGDIDRMIELKSSGVDAQVQIMSWNEWKTAQGTLRSHFWLYLVGNLRADLRDAAPFVRAVQDPFGILAAATNEDTIRRRTVQLRVREFAAADQLTLGVRNGQAL